VVDVAYVRVIGMQEAQGELAEHHRSTALPIVTVRSVGRSK
jgi:hypothetical protein